MLATDEVLTIANKLREQHTQDGSRLRRLLSYRRHGVGPHGVLGGEGLVAGLPSGLPTELRKLAEVSRVNLLGYVVSARVQDMYVEGLQTGDSPENVQAWQTWQANGMDARQMGVHRSALTFGSAYAVVLPGSPGPVVRGVSPQDIAVAYGDDDVWPAFALWKKGRGSWWLLDDVHTYVLSESDGGFGLLDVREHGAGVTPVVRFREAIDLDVDVQGVVEPLIALQDQINVTSFGLHVAQHYGAFRQRYILGWLADSEAEAIKMGASKLMMIEDSPGDVQVGEFGQTDLRGYIESREATIRHLATVSQTPVHELMGQFVNLSAEALEAAKASHHAGVEENRVAFGEAWEQTLRLAGSLGGLVVEDEASVVWRDTTMRSMTEIAEGLGTLSEKLGVPPRSLWPRIPGVSQHELAQWKAMASEPDALDAALAALQRQSSGA